MPLEAPILLPMPAQLYRVDNCRLTLRECWYQTRSGTSSSFGSSNCSGSGMPIPPMPYPESVHQNSLPPESIPEAARKARSLVSELEA